MPTSVTTVPLHAAQIETQSNFIGRNKFDFRTSLHDVRKFARIPWLHWLERFSEEVGRRTEGCVLESFTVLREEMDGILFSELRAPFYYTVRDLLAYLIMVL